jgi:hypothetical protein
MFQLKPLSREAIPGALQKAERYRFLNEPAEAESICTDILQTDPENQEAIIMLLLAVSDRFSKGYGVTDVQLKELLARLKNEYEREYYSGIIAERRAKAKLAQGTPGCRYWAYDLFCDAMTFYEKAEAISPPGNDDALLRWNTCARMISMNKLEARVEEKTEPEFD